MHDAVNLEQAGTPTAVVITEEFVHEAQEQRAVLGMETLEPVIIPHPLSALNDAEIDARAEEVARLAPLVWTGRQKP